MAKQSKIKEQINKISFVVFVIRLRASFYCAGWALAAKYVWTWKQIFSEITIFSTENGTKRDLFANMHWGPHEQPKPRVAGGQRSSNCETKRGSLCTFILFGTTHIHIPIVSGSIEDPNGKTSSWSKASLRMCDFPSRQGPAIATTQMGPTGRRRHQKQIYRAFMDVTRKQLYLRAKELKGKSQTFLT